jgi:phage recombination protein Bet
VSLTTQNPIRESVDLIKRTVAKGASDQELELFIRQCERTGLDPFARQIYAIKRWDAQVGADVMQTQVSIDGLRTLAAETGEMGGQDGPYWSGTQGMWTDAWLQSGTPKAAKVTVYRYVGDRRASFTGVALWDSYCQRKKDGTPTRMWSQMGPEMLAKCAEALALRKAFPQKLSGLYTTDEMSQASSEQPISMRDPQKGLRAALEKDDGQSPTLPPPIAPADAVEGSEGTAGVPSGTRDAVGGALGRLSSSQRSAALGLADEQRLRLPDDPGFSVQDANNWMTVIGQVRKS